MIVELLRTRFPVSIFVIALVLRISWVAVSGENGLQSSDDAKAYHDLAVNLVERHEFVTVVDPPHSLNVPYATRPPLTPFALAAVYFVFGPHLLVGQLLFALIGALSVVAVYLLGRQLFSADVGILAGVFAAAYPFFVFLTAVPLTENLAILLYTLLALLLTRKNLTYGLKRAVLTGSVLGLAGLDRPQILGFVPFLAMLVVLDTGQRPAQGMKWLAVSLLCATVVMAPWTVRNWVVTGGLFPISLQGGAALHMGNNPYTQTALDLQWAGSRGWHDDPRAGEELVGLSPLDADRKAFQLGTAYMRDHPGRTLYYSIQKVGLLFKAYANPIARISWYPVFALSLLGFIWAARQWRQLLPLYLLVLQTMLTAAVFTSTPRFRAPVEPIFLLLAAYALQRLWVRRAVLPSRQ